MKFYSMENISENVLDGLSKEDQKDNKKTNSEGDDEEQNHELPTSSKNENQEKPSCSKQQQPSNEQRLLIPEKYYRLSMSELRLYGNFLKVLVLSSLRKVGVCVLDDFLPAHHADAVKNEVEMLYQQKKNPAKEPAIVSNNLEYRGDECTWVSGQQNTQSIQILGKAFQNLILALSHLPELRRSKIFKITHKSHFQVSRFIDGKQGYKAHVENPNNNGRLISVCYYTNKDYVRTEHGGVVRFHLDKNSKRVDVEPMFNVAVIYWSDKRVIKEVLPSNNRDLYHMTSWFFGTTTI